MAAAPIGRYIQRMAQLGLRPGRVGQRHDSYPTGAPPRSPEGELTLTRPTYSITIYGCDIYDTA